MKNQHLLPLLSDSRYRLVRLLKERGQATIDDLASALALAPTTVRQHTDRLLEMGLLDREPLADGPGRPTMLYRLSATAEGLFPSQNGALFGQIVEFLVHQGYPGLVDDFFQKIWRERRQELSDRIEAAGADDIADRLNVVREFLSEQGFLPEISIEEGRATIRECNCPFSDGVRATRLPCRLEAQLLEHALQRDLNRVAYIPDGHPHCIYEFSVARDPADDA